MEKINAEVFLTVAETGSFRKAAEVLDYTQAGISYIVSAMEEEMGLNLFIREHGGVKLSMEGKALLPQIMQLKAWERQFNQNVDELKGLERGTVRVQIFDSISMHWIPGIIRKFQDDFPGVTIELVSEEDSLLAEEMVMNGEVDCGFFLTKVISKMDVFPLIEESVLAVVSPEHPLANRKCFPIKELGNYPYIGMKFDNHTGIGNIFKNHNIDLNPAFSMDNDNAAMAMVEQNLGYGIFPELLLKDISFKLKKMEFDEPQKRIISIGTRSIDSCSKACLKFIEYTKKWVAENHSGKLLF